MSSDSDPDRKKKHATRKKSPPVGKTRARTWRGEGYPGSRAIRATADRIAGQLEEERLQNS